MKKVCDWQLSNLKAETMNGFGGIEKIEENGWIRGVFYTGVMATYYSTKDKTYLDKTMTWATNNHFQPGSRPRHADDHVVGQTYLELFMLKKDSNMILPLKGNLDLMIKEPMPASVVGWNKDHNWAWCDALFMSPPAMVRMYAATKNAKYLQLMDTMWWETNAYLYDQEEKLYYRDAEYKVKPDGSQLKTKHGKKIFWGRGNGWVMGGIVRVLQYLPQTHPSYPKYTKLYKDMSNQIANLQGQDGLWRASLLDSAEYPAPETSSSSFFCYSLSWGINNGILDKEKYLPIVKKAWKGLVNSVGESGKLGWVQQVGHSPQNVSKEDNMDYGVGAFLLAAGEMAKLR